MIQHFELYKVSRRGNIVLELLIEQRTIFDDRFIIVPVTHKIKPYDVSEDVFFNCPNNCVLYLIKGVGKNTQRIPIQKGKLL